MKKALRVLLIGLFVGPIAAVVVRAQGEELTLRLSRDFGYGGFGGDIQGTFSLRVTGPADLARVEFYIDDTKIGEASAVPFRLQFKTDDYPLGTHSLRAVGYTTGGRQLTSQTITATFVSASVGTRSVFRILVPLLVIIVGGLLLAALIAILTGRKTSALPAGSPRQYPLGGGICRRCGRPFPFHLYGLNLLTDKFDRCPYCGKWAAVRRLSLDKLRAAEQAEFEAAQAQVPEASEEEELRKELDDSKYRSLE